MRFKINYCSYIGNTYMILCHKKMEAKYTNFEKENRYKEQKRRYNLG